MRLLQVQSSHLKIALTLFSLVIIAGIIGAIVFIIIRQRRKKEEQKRLKQTNRIKSTSTETQQQSNLLNSNKGFQTLSQSINDSTNVSTIIAGRVNENSVIEQDKQCVPIQAKNSETTLPNKANETYNMPNESNSPVNNPSNIIININNKRRLSTSSYATSNFEDNVDTSEIEKDIKCQMKKFIIGNVS